MTDASWAPGDRRLQRFLADYGQEIVVLLSIVALFVIVGAVNPRFLSDTNLTSIFAGNAYIAVAAIGMSMVIISGHIDVSVGSLIGVLATIAGTLAVNGYPIVDRLDRAHHLRGRRECGSRRTRRLYAHSLDRRDARHAVDPQRRPHQRDRRRLDHRHAARIHDRAGKALRNPRTRLFHGHPHHHRGMFHAIHRLRTCHLCGRRQRRGGACGRRRSGAHRRRRLRAAWPVRRNCRSSVRNATAGHSIDRSAQPRTYRDHRFGDRRSFDPRRHRHRRRVDTGRHPIRHHRLGAHLPQCFRLLAARRARPHDPRNGARRHGAAAEKMHDSCAALPPRDHSRCC